MTNIKLLQRLSNNIRGNIASLHIQNGLKPKQYSERINYLFGITKKIFINRYLKNSYIKQILQLQKQPPAVRPVTLLKRDSNTGGFFKICKIFKRSYFEENILTVASSVTNGIIQFIEWFEHNYYQDSRAVYQLLV